MNFSFRPASNHSTHESNPLSNVLTTLNKSYGPSNTAQDWHRDHNNGQAHSASTIELSLLATFNSGFGEGAAEIVAHDPATQRLFVTNAEEKTVDILDISDPKNPTKVGFIDVSEIGGEDLWPKQRRSRQRYCCDRR